MTFKCQWFSVPDIIDRNLSTTSIHFLLNSDGIWALISFRLTRNPIWDSEVSIFYILLKILFQLKSLWNVAHLREQNLFKCSRTRNSCILRPFFPFICSQFVNRSQEKADGSLQSFESMAVLKYLRHFFDFINKSASWTSAVLSLTWKL